MINSTNENLWKVLKENTFEITATINSELICSICKKIMIRPQILQCGCRYCFDCLLSFLNGEEKHCLGSLEYCKNELINLDQNVFLDQATNFKISRIIVRCPMNSCEVMTELGNMTDHMTICDRKPVMCPYYKIGCHKNEMDFNNIVLHFKEENCSHARLLMECLDNCMNEIKHLRTCILDLEKENGFVKEQVEFLKMESKQIHSGLERNIAKLCEENTCLRDQETANLDRIKRIEVTLAMQMKLEENRQIGQYGSKSNHRTGDLVRLIECPKCKIGYTLCVNGTLHFRCKACLAQFCGGCSQLFVNICGNPHCEMTSFHAHHPRNCLYFLRDYTTEELENMLKGFEYPKLEGKPEKQCQFNITYDRTVKDSTCDKEDVYNTTGMCEHHYKTYLVQFINHCKIDPVDFVDSESLNLMLWQMAVDRLNLLENEDDDQFKERLKKQVKDNCLFYIP